MGWRTDDGGLAGPVGVGGAPDEETVEGNKVDVFLLRTMQDFELIGAAERWGEGGLDELPILDFLGPAAGIVEEECPRVGGGVDGIDFEFLHLRAIARSKDPQADIMLHAALQGDNGGNGTGMARTQIVARCHIAVAVNGADVLYLGTRAHEFGGILYGPCAGCLKRFHIDAACRFCTLGCGVADGGGKGCGLR